MTSPLFVAATVGIILGTERFEACVDFYRSTLGLPIGFEKERFVCLRFGSGYLVIETGGVARDTRKRADENPTMLRFDVADVESAVEALRERGVEVTLKRFEWGTVGTFVEPDGNACELKDAGDPFFD